MMADSNYAATSKISEPNSNSSLKTTNNLMEGMISTFNTGFTALSDKLLSIDTEMKGIRRDVSGALKSSTGLKSCVKK
jgi:hypothetical protein